MLRSYKHRIVRCYFQSLMETRECRLSGTLRRCLQMCAVVSFGIAVSASSSAGSAFPKDQQLLVGDYRNVAPGAFRRILVGSGRIVSYDIWRATSTGNLQHLHFDLISPAKLPIESNQYRVASQGYRCSQIGLHFYRSASGEVSPEFLVFRYQGLEQPLSWGGPSTHETDLEKDRTEVAKLA